MPVAALLRALHTDPGALRLRWWESCLPTASLSEADGLSEVSVVVVLDIDIISDVSEILSCARFCCARLAVGDKSFTYGIVNGLVGTGGGANVGMGSGGGLGLTTTRSNGRDDGELLRLDESGDISEPSGRVMIRSWVSKCPLSLISGISPLLLRWSSYFPSPTGRLRLRMALLVSLTMVTNTIMPIMMLRTEAMAVTLLV